MSDVTYRNSFNDEYSFHFWGEQSLEDMLAIIDHMTINANGRFHNHVSDESAEAEDEPR